MTQPTKRDLTLNLDDYSETGLIALLTLVRAEAATSLIALSRKPHVFSEKTRVEQQAPSERLEATSSALIHYLVARINPPKTIPFAEPTREQAIARISEIDKMFEEAKGWGSWMVEAANEREDLATKWGLPQKYQARSNGKRVD